MPMPIINGGGDSNIMLLHRMCVAMLVFFAVVAIAASIILMLKKKEYIKRSGFRAFWNSTLKHNIFFDVSASMVGLILSVYAVAGIYFLS